MANHTAPLIFILDDDAEAGALMREQLALKVEARVRVFLSFDEMAAADDLQAVDLFVIDVKLKEDFSGFEVPAALPPRCRFAAFLFVSGFPLNEAQYNEVAGLAFFDFVAKPATTTHFLHRVKLLLAARLRIPGKIGGHILEQWSRSPFVAAVVDANYRIRLCNRQLVAVLGVESPRALVGRLWFEFLPDKGGQVEAFRQMHAAVLVGQNVPYGEHVGRLCGAGGRQSVIKWWHSSFLGPDNEDLLLSIGMPSGYKSALAMEVRKAWRECIQQHQATIRAIKRRPLRIEPAATCAPTPNEGGNNADHRIGPMERYSPF